jgi:hypothetical protein
LATVRTADRVRDSTRAETFRERSGEQNENIDESYEPPGSPIPNGELATNRLELSPNGHADGPWPQFAPAKWGHETDDRRMYRTADGAELIEVVRFNTDKGKAFYQYDVQRGMWVGKRGASLPKPRPLYRLDELAASPGAPVVVCEGETKTTAITDELGLLATSPMGGAKSIGEVDWQPLAGRTVTIWPDADRPGADMAAKLAPMLQKLGCTVRVVQLPDGVFDGWDVIDALADSVDIKALLDGAVEVEPPELPVKPIIPFSWGELEGFDPPPLRFVVDSLIPEATVTGLFGIGGAGKTMLAQLLASCCASWPDFLGLSTRRCRAMAVFCEDRKAEVWRRQVRINRELALRMAEIDENFLPVIRAGEDSTLAQMGTGKNQGLLVDGPFMPELVGGIERFKPAVLLLDNILQMYAGNINDPVQVTRFVRMMTKLADRYNMAIVLLGHVAKAEGSTFMGSQSWSDALRSRLLLEWTKENGELEQRLILRRPKANYAPEDKEKIELVWSGNGVLVAKRQRPRTFGDKLDLEEHKAKARTAFLAGLDALTAQGIHMSHSKNSSQNWAPMMIIRHGHGAGFAMAELDKAMIELLNSGKIAANQPFGARRVNNRMQVKGIVRVPELGL